MGVRSDKGRRIANLITGKTGLITEWDLQQGLLTERPYGFTLSSDRKLERHSALIRALPHDVPHAVIRFDNTMESIHDAWITFRIDAGLELIAQLEGRNHGRTQRQR